MAGKTAPKRYTDRSANVEAVALCVLVAGFGLAAMGTLGAAGGRAIASDGHARAVAVASQAGTLEVVGEFNRGIHGLPRPGTAAWRGLVSEVRGAFATGAAGPAVLDTERYFPESIGDAFLEARRSVSRPVAEHGVAQMSTGAVGENMLESWAAETAEMRAAQAFAAAHRGWTATWMRAAFRNLVVPHGKTSPMQVDQLVGISYAGQGAGPWHVDPGALNTVLTLRGAGTERLAAMPAELRGRTWNPSVFTPVDESRLGGASVLQAPQGWTLVSPSAQVRAVVGAAAEPLLHRSPANDPGRVWLVEPFGLRTMATGESGGGL